ncbi:hypothetical protein EB052_02200 [bacterium]|nr:hypothetical protein [bacterium]
MVFAITEIVSETEAVVAGGITVCIAEEDEEKFWLPLNNDKKQWIDEYREQTIAALPIFVGDTVVVRKDHDTYHIASVNLGEDDERHEIREALSRE